MSEKIKKSIKELDDYMGKVKSGEIITTTKENLLKVLNETLAEELKPFQKQLQALKDENKTLKNETNILRSLVSENKVVIQQDNTKLKDQLERVKRERDGYSYNLGIQERTSDERKLVIDKLKADNTRYKEAYQSKVNKLVEMLNNSLKQQGMCLQPKQIRELQALEEQKEQ